MPRLACCSPWATRNRSRSGSTAYSSHRTGDGVAGLGEHRDTPINIELHTRIHERLPLDTVDITPAIRPCDARPGIHPIRRRAR